MVSCTNSLGICLCFSCGSLKVKEELVSGVIEGNEGEENFEVDGTEI